MPAPRTKRVPDEHARQVFERLNRSGELPVILAVIWDHKDRLSENLDRKLRTLKLTDSESLAEFQMDQGALREIERLASSFQALGERLPLREDGSDGLDARPPRTRNGGTPRGGL